jgi:hypothetical protein
MSHRKQNLNPVFAAWLWFSWKAAKFSRSQPVGALIGCHLVHLLEKALHDASDWGVRASATSIP